MVLNCRNSIHGSGRPHPRPGKWPGLGALLNTACRRIAANIAAAFRGVEQCRQFGQHRIAAGRARFVLAEIGPQNRGCLWAANQGTSVAEGVASLGHFGPTPADGSLGSRARRAGDGARRRRELARAASHRRSPAHADPERRDRDARLVKALEANPLYLAWTNVAEAIEALRDADLRSRAHDRADRPKRYARPQAGDHSLCSLLPTAQAQAAAEPVAAAVRRQARSRPAALPHSRACRGQGQLRSAPDTVRRRESRRPAAEAQAAAGRQRVRPGAEAAEEAEVAIVSAPVRRFLKALSGRLIPGARRRKCVAQSAGRDIVHCSTGDAARQHGVGYDDGKLQAGSARHFRDAASSNTARRR